MGVEGGGDENGRGKRGDEMYATGKIQFYWLERWSSDIIKTHNNTPYIHHE